MRRTRAPCRKCKALYRLRLSLQPTKYPRVPRKRKRIVPMELVTVHFTK